MEEILKDLKSYGDESDRIRKALKREAGLLQELNTHIIEEFKKLMAAVVQADNALRKGEDITTLVTKVTTSRRMFYKIGREAVKLKSHSGLEETMSSIENYTKAVVTGLDQLIRDLKNPARRPSDALSVINKIETTLEIAKMGISKALVREYQFLGTRIKNSA